MDEENRAEGLGSNRFGLDFNCPEFKHPFG